MINLALIKDLCKQKGITLKKLAEDIQISQTGLTSAIKNNGTTLETLDKIANYFKVSVGYFFGEQDKTTAILKKLLSDFAQREISEKIHTAYNFINNMMMGMNYEDRNEIALLIKKKFDNTPVNMDGCFWQIYKSLSDSLSIQEMSELSTDDNVRIMVSYSGYYSIYQLGIEDFVRFWLDMNKRDISPLRCVDGNLEKWEKVPWTIEL